MAPFDCLPVFWEVGVQVVQVQPGQGRRCHIEVVEMQPPDQLANEPGDQADINQEQDHAEPQLDRDMGNRVVITVTGSDGDDEGTKNVLFVLWYIPPYDI